MKGKDNKPHIGIFGKRNAGKSSLINYLTMQNTAIVSEHAGTTTDPVKKSVEIFGVGPAVIIDTAGFDDEGNLGKLRVEKTRQIISSIDLAVFILVNNSLDDREQNIIEALQDFDVPLLFVHNKSDIQPLADELKQKIKQTYRSEIIDFSSFSEQFRENLLQKIKQSIPENAYRQNSLLKDVVKPKDVVLLVTPIDSEAPEGRMILPQVMAWRDLLDNDCICMSVKDTELKDFMKLNIKPDLVITDSQVFEFVSQTIPKDIPLTSFSIVFAHYKGNFKKFMEGTPAIPNLQEGDRVLILESCTHQVSCDDIGRVKIPAWLEKFTGKRLQFEFVSGLSNLPENIKDFKLVVQCGGCMITPKQVKGRLRAFVKQNIPVSNYGMAIAYMNGIFERAIEPFKHINN